jgi:hypothetical protein
MKGKKKVKKPAKGKREPKLILQSLAECPRCHHYNCICLIKNYGRL